MMPGEFDRRVFLLFNQNNKPDRDRMSGFLRFAATHQVKWDIRMLDGASPTYVEDCRRLSAEWPADAVVYSEDDLLRQLFPRVRGRGRAPVRIGIDAMGSRRAPHVHIRLDARELVGAALDLFARRGYRNFAYLSTDAPGEQGHARAMARTYREQAGRRGIPAHVFRMEYKTGLTSALASVSEWLRGLPKPCGVLAYSDDIARHILDACRLSRLAVPAQISIIGVDDHTDLCETSRPTLTSVLPDFERSGYLAAQSLLRVFSRRKPAKLVPAEFSYGIKSIVERGSTQDMRNCGRLATAVREMIRAEGAGPLTVAAIARRLNASERLLEMHFKTVSGHTIRDELLAFRLELLKDRLLSDSHPLGELAAQCGFRTANAAQIAFRRRFGMSMRECRKRLGGRQP